MGDRVNNVTGSVDVTVLLFYRPDNIPTRLRVSNITVPLPRPIPGFITGLSGHERRESMMWARRFADAKGLEMLVVDLGAGFDLPLYPRVLSPEELPQHDVLNLFRASKTLIAIIAEHWEKWITADEGAEMAATYDWRRPADFVARRPDLLPRLLKLERFKHINLVTHPVITTFHSEPFTATTFRSGYPSITKAAVRYHPEIEVVV